MILTIVCACVGVCGMWGRYVCVQNIPKTSAPKKETTKMIHRPQLRMRTASAAACDDDSPDITIRMSRKSASIREKQS